MQGPSARHQIFSYLCKQDVASRPSIAQALRLSMPTVLKVSDDFVKRGLVQEVGELASTGGRKARALRLNAGLHHAIGIDVTRGHISLVLMDLRGHIVKSRRIQRAFSLDDAYMLKLADDVRALVREAGLDDASILGAGISVPAIVDAAGQRIVDSHALALQDVPLDRFAAQLPYPRILLNDADAAAAAQVLSQEAVINLVYLSLSGSVGGAIYIDGQAYPGQNRRAGEFGHMCVHPGGRPCYCGQRGCLDAYCSSLVLSSLAPDGRLETFFSQLDAGEHAAVTAWDDYVETLCIALNSLRMAFDCPIVLGGYVGAHLEGRMEKIRQRAAQLNTFEDAANDLYPCNHRYEASALGAALHYIEGYTASL